MKKKSKKKQPIVVTVSFLNGRRLDTSPDATLIVDDEGRLWRVSFGYSTTAELIKFPADRA